jgi:GntR family transcriptional regulator/MocR family aminotransferase
MERGTPRFRDGSSGGRDGSSGGRDVLLEMELRRGQLRRNLRRSLREAIQEGRLSAGARLPASRRLAADLRVSRGVVTDTYDQLAAEGYLTMAARKAPLVAGIAPARPTTAPPVDRTWRIDFAASTPDIELFPRRAWLRAAERAVRQAPNDALDYGDHRGRIELRRALSDYLGRVRAVRVDPERIVVSQGFTQALDLLGRVLAARGNTSLAFETPSMASEWATVEASRLRIVPVPVDADGIVVARLAAVDAPAVVVTPAHQFPTGAVLAPMRRHALLAWATDRGRLIVEDDYDAEYRYDRSAVGALQGLAPDRVAHIGTASKTLAPGVRLGWMSLPADLVDEMRATKGAADSGSPAIDQLVLADLLSSGEYDRHVARARHVYRRRRDRLVQALTAALPRLQIDGAAAGLHVLLRLPDASDDLAVVEAAAQRGVRVTALSAMSLVDSPDRGLVLGYGRLPVERVEDAVTSLAASLSDAGIAGVARTTAGADAVQASSS